MSMINISNVINVSVLATPTGLAPYSINNVVCFTEDVPVVSITNFAVYSSLQQVALDWGSTSNVYKAALGVFSQSPNVITGNGLFVVVPMLSAETLSEAIIRAQGYVYFGACGYTMAVSDDDYFAAAEVGQAARIMVFKLVTQLADMQSPNGIAYRIQQANLEHGRVLYYGLANPEKYVWGYIGNLMSTNFSATNTTRTMAYKQFAGVVGDESLNQSVLQVCESVGVDCYPIIAGFPCNISNGANNFVDNVYNLDWFVGAIQVAGFNYLAQTQTKIPQTEIGMDGLKGAYRVVCQQSVANGFVSPGAWTNPDTFGNPQDFKRNIVDFGYYIYSIPVAVQSPADRELRKAPAVQIAIKYAGAIQKSDVLVYINF